MKKDTKDINKNIKKLEDTLKNSSLLELNELYIKYETSIDGINIVEASERLDKYGKNIIYKGKHKTIINKLLEVIINPFNIVLIIIAIVTFVTDVVISATPSYATFILILAATFLSATISFMQQQKSDKAASKLQKMISNKVDVIRSGTIHEIDIQDVVIGDIVKLSAGDMIPGDVRFIYTKDLFIDQASLTGESSPV